MKSACLILLLLAAALQGHAAAGEPGYGLLPR